MPLRISAAVFTFTCVLASLLMGAAADQIDDILRQPGPLFRKQLELSNILAKLDSSERQKTLDKFYAEYGGIQKYQQMEARLTGLAQQVRDLSVLTNTRADRLASPLPSVAPAPEQFLGRQAMRLATDAIDIRVTAQIAAASAAVDLDKVRANLAQARAVYAAGQTVNPSLLVAGVVNSAISDAKQRALKEATKALPMWTSANEQLFRGAKQLNKKSEEIRIHVETTVRSIMSDVAATNVTIKAAQDALHANPSDRLTRYSTLFDAIGNNAERLRVLNDAMFGRLDKVVAITDATRQIVHLSEQVTTLNADKSNLLSGVQGRSG
jgi:hypothetical protein